jgi:hypothetical protein
MLGWHHQFLIPHWGEEEVVRVEQVQNFWKEIPLLQKLEEGVVVALLLQQKLRQALNVEEVEAVEGDPEQKKWDEQLKKQNQGVEVEGEGELQWRFWQWMMKVFLKKEVGLKLSS